MFNLHTVLSTEASAAALIGLCHNPRGHEARFVCASDLVEFGLCPRRWLEAPDPEDPLLGYGPPVAEWLAFDTVIGRRHFVGRPATYEASLLKCPGCDSPGPALTCKKCGLRRKRTVAPRPWTGSAHYCATWEAERKARGVRILHPRAFEAADTGAERIRKDAPTAALAAGAQCSRMLVGEWHSPDHDVTVPVWAWVSILPEPEGPLGACAARVTETADADPRAWERTVVCRGLHIEAALAIGLLNSDPRNTRRDYLWVLLEKSLPRVLARRRLSREALIEGAKRLDQLLATYALALKTRTFPSFEPAAGTLASAWQTADIAAWLTAGSGPDGGYLAPALLAQPPEETAPAES